MIRQLKAALLLSGILSIPFAPAGLGARNVRNVEDYLGSQFSAAELKPFRTTADSTVATVATVATAADTIARWNQIAVDASGLDHTPVAAGDPRVFGEQLGPVRAARAIAIVHIAIFDSVNGVVGSY